MASEPRVLIYDLETAPNVGYTWGKWDQNVVQFQQDWFILTVSWKWLGEKRVYVKGLPDYVSYDLDHTFDFDLVMDLRELFDEADVAVTHNGNAFDQPKARTRMAYWEIDPPSPFREIDTLKVARKEFAFTSNTLADLARQLGLGEKGKPGFDVWLGCMSGDLAAWRKMKAYCRHDVQLLERLYLRLRPWMTDHPNLALISDKPRACPKCGVEGSMEGRGWKYNTVTKRQRFQCTVCRGYCSGRAIQKSEGLYVP